MDIYEFNKLIGSGMYGQVKNNIIRLSLYKRVMNVMYKEEDMQHAADEKEANETNRSFRDKKRRKTFQ